MNQTLLLKAVQAIFITNSSPITVSGIQEILASKNLKPNKTTLYRMLEKIKIQGFIEEILLNDKITYYERKANHHHHFRCNDCDYIRCITDPSLEEKIHSLQDALESDGLKIDSHHFFLTGTCASCT